MGLSFCFRVALKTRRTVLEGILFLAASPAIPLGLQVFSVEFTPLNVSHFSRDPGSEDRPVLELGFLAWEAKSKWAIWF